jgi:hypothetical protein
MLNYDLEKMDYANAFPHIFNYIAKSLFPGLGGGSSHECDAKMEIDGEMVDVDLMELVKDEELRLKVESMVKVEDFELSEELVELLSAQSRKRFELQTPPTSSMTLPTRLEVKIYEKI